MNDREYQASLALKTISLSLGQRKMGMSDESISELIEEAISMVTNNGGFMNRTPPEAITIGMFIAGAMFALDDFRPLAVTNK